MEATGPVPSEIEAATCSSSNQNVETGKASPKLENTTLVASRSNAAVEGNTDPPDQSVTPNKNKILHIHITAQSKKEPSLDFETEILKLCPDLLWQVNNRHETLLHVNIHSGATCSSSNQNGKTDKPSPELDINDVIDLFYEAAVKGEFKPFKNVLKPTLDRIVTPNKNTILHIYITALSKMENRSNLWRTPRDRLKFADEILEKCPGLLWQVNNKDETLLHIAARHGHVDVVEFLFRKCKETHQDDQEKGVGAARQMLRRTNKAKDTALHEAVRFNHLNVVKRLIEEDGDYSYDANAAGETPLYLAAHRGYRDILQEIVISNPSSAYGGPKGRTALHAAVLRNDRGSTREMVCKNKHLTKIKDKQGWIPLHYATDYGYTDVVRILLAIDRSTAYCFTDKGKKTALHIAASHGNVGIMKELISRCPGCSELVDERGWNVLHFAMESKKSKAIKLVLQNPSLSNLINEYNKDGNTPLHQLAALGFYMPSFIGHPKVDKLALDKQNLNALDILGKDELSREQKDLLNCLQKNGIREGGRVEVNKDEGNTEGRGPSSCDGKGKNKDSNSTANIQEARNAHLVVATLIATVTFAAGITVPGGYKNNGPDEGTAILTRSIAFSIFVIIDTIALMLSSSAVLHHLSMALDKYRKEERNNSELIHKLQLTILAMYAMLFAFITGTYAILAPSSGLAISACVLGCIFLLFGHLISEYLLSFMFSLIDFLSEKKEILDQRASECCYRLALLLEASARLCLCARRDQLNCIYFL